MKKRKFISRRRFLAFGCAAASGAWWVNSSHAAAAKFIRQQVAETGKPLPKAPANPDPESWKENAVTVSWLGHSTVLINFYGLKILTDPVLFPRVGASIGFGTIGPKRLVAPALTVDQLPKIDLVLLSHAHMDHLDFRTLNSLANTPKIVTARSTADLFDDTRFKDVSELAWEQSTRVQTSHGAVRVQAFQVKHWGARWRRDKHRGYNGYVLEREGRKIIFGGDTAFCPTFGDLRSQGSFDIALMPIGAYHPWTCSHCTPEQAVTMATAAGAKYFIPIHHRTFPLGREGPVEPLQRLETALEREHDRLALRNVGETFSLA